MRKVHLKAYIANNLGDDLFIRIICERYKNTKFLLSGKKEYKNSFQDIKNLIYISEDGKVPKVLNKIYRLYLKLIKKDKSIINNRYFFITNLISKIIKVNVLIIGSGFMEYHDWRYLVNEEYYDSKPYIIGCNFGPYKSNEFVKKYEGLFENAKLVSFREKSSFELFKGLSNTQYASDIVFSLNHNDNKNKNEYGDYYLLTVMNFDGEDQKMYKDKIIEISNKLLIDNKKIIVLSFCDSQGDNLFGDKVYEELNKNKLIKLLSYNDLGMQKSLDIIRNSEKIISTRFHGMILGFLYKKPVIPICYSEKTVNVLRDMGIEKNIFEFRNIDELDVAKLDEYFINISDEKLEFLINDSNRHFKLLDEELKND